MSVPERPILAIIEDPLAVPPLVQANCVA
jgi:hypothetical protein